MKLKSIAYLCVMAAAFASCMTGCDNNKNKPDPKNSEALFERKTVAGAYSGLEGIYVFNKTNDQLYWDSDTNTARLLNNDGTKYIEVALNGPVPTSGQTVNVSVVNRGMTDGLKNYSSLQMRVSKKNNDYVWLWSDSEMLGLLIRRW